jgi:hypothetical protein
MDIIVIVHGFGRFNDARTNGVGDGIDWRMVDPYDSDRSAFLYRNLHDWSPELKGQFDCYQGARQESGPTWLSEFTHLGNTLKPIR